MIQELTIGEWIENLRTEQKISKKQLCHGLCSLTAISRYEEGIRYPSRFILEYFFQRLGKNIALSDMILDSDEYELCTERGRIERDLKEKNFAAANGRLNSYENQKKKLENIHQQYICYTRGRLCEAERDFAKAEAHYVQALVCTKNEDYMEALEHRLLSLIELDIIEKLLQLSCRKKESKHAMSGFLKMLHYIENHKVIDEIKNKIYPRIFLKTAMENLTLYNYGIAQEQAEKAIEILRKEFKISNLMEGIHILMELKKNKPVEDHFEGLSKCNSFVALNILDIDAADEFEIMETVRENGWENIIEHLS